MKTFLILFGLIFFQLSTFQAFAKDTISDFEKVFPGALRVEGTQLVGEDGKPVILKGVSLGWHNWWPRFYNASTVSWLKNDWNAQVVRASIGVDVSKGFLENPEFALEKIQAVVDAAIAENIYVIIDWHSHHLVEKEAIEFFGKMAQKYGESPHVIYEIFNEPVELEWSEIKDYSEKVIHEIRKYDLDNLILVGTPTWSQDVDVVSDHPLTGFSNLMYVLHFYAGTHQESLRSKANKALESGLPIFVSESAGMNSDGNGPIDWSSWKAWTEWMDSMAISRIAWSISDKDETCSMLLKSASSFGRWEEDDLNIWGKYIREYLRYDQIENRYFGN